ncbi:hypothetical protein Tco_0729892 [Tanacetum coccineum]|uniref:Uncharacterized protein n=1 Tax=Tanacetum coccineum TaxID=301880 RepID=A0ABQ4YSM1_9ASTR
MTVIAFDSDVDEAPMAQTMFMANLSSADPVYDEAGGESVETLAEIVEEAKVEKPLAALAIKLAVYT